jgi:phosphoribosylformimino-5-aminoimidazole carboxamide ribotide isomerase
MKAIPAIDLRDGACVQLVGGAFENEKVRITDVVGVSQRFANAGLRTQHIVDLDAAVGKGSNFDTIKTLVQQPDLQLQVGGGIRDTDAAVRLFDLGVSRVVVGTRAIDDRAWLETLAARFPGQLVLAADVRERDIVTKGWTHRTGHRIDQFLAGLTGVPLAGVLVTAVHVEGQLQGIDLPLFETSVAASPVPVIASGGVTSLEDLRHLSQARVAAAVIGMAIYTERIPLASLSTEF